MELHHANPYHIPPPPEHHQVTHYQTLGNQAVLGGSTKSSPAISVNTEFSRDSGFASQDHDFEQRDNQPIYEVTYRHFSFDFSFHNEWFLPIYYERIVFIILRFITSKARLQMFPDAFPGTLSVSNFVHFLRAEIWYVVGEIFRFPRTSKWTRNNRSTLLESGIGDILILSSKVMISSVHLP